MHNGRIFLKDHPAIVIIVSRQGTHLKIKHDFNVTCLNIFVIINNRNFLIENRIIKECPRIRA